MFSSATNREPGRSPGPESSASADQAGSFSQPVPEILLSLPTGSSEGSLTFALSFCRWLLAAFERVELYAESPSPGEWGAFVKDFAPHELSRPDGLDQSRPFHVQDNLRVRFVDHPLEAPAPRKSGNLSAAGTDWALLPPPQSRPGRVLVRAFQADVSPSLVPYVDRASLWVALLPADLQAFMRYYLLIRSAASLGRPSPRFSMVLHRCGSDHDLKKIRLAWDTVTERFLGWTVPILGQIDLGYLSAEDLPAHRRVRLCEETLGPPWPSDFQAQCEAAQAPQIYDAAPTADQSEEENRLSGAAPFLRAEAGSSRWD
jgi:hypothetical protein